ncbi:RING-H2 finger protein ATL79-like [Rhodamnia argentea]|uniref:RING-type E3 ubiquitin transferase n=1 Tax=Rhodamnia argentea TaxID=178133 RepID=A0A8B8PZN0_9MYRT|nr:RING-H2 finger protein ATL79-like [Rhodamnia argentea]
MRPSPMETATRAAAATAMHPALHLAPPPAATCGPHGCSWRATPHSDCSTGDLQTYVVVLVLCFVICALALIFAVRCFLRGGGAPQPPPPPPTRLPPLARGEAEPKSSGEAAAPPMAAAALVVFSPEVELAGAEAECAICLTEFVGGEEIRVLKSCGHGFHDQCIEKWLSSKSSCPTCRSSCVVAGCSEHENGTAQCSENGGATASLSHEATEQA